MRDRVRRKGVDAYQVKLPANEKGLLRELLSQLREELLASTDSPHLRRVFPPAYADDAERDAGYQVLTRDELLEARLAAIDEVEATLDGGRLDKPQLTAWMTTLNSIRLVIGTRLDVEEELPDLDPDDPLTPAYAVYVYLGVLLEQVVEALAEDVGSEGG